MNNWIIKTIASLPLTINKKLKVPNLKQLTEDHWMLPPFSIFLWYCFLSGLIGVVLPIVLTVSAGCKIIFGYWYPLFINTAIITTSPLSGLIANCVIIFIMISIGMGLLLCEIDDYLKEEEIK